MENKGQK